MNSPSVIDLSDAVAALFDDAPLILFRSFVEPRPPVDENDVVQAYVVLHPGPGDSTSSRLDRQPGQLLWSFHLTAAGGDQNYCGHAIDQIRARIDGRRLQVAGATVGLMQPPFGALPPPMRPDYDVSPPRLFVPLEYQVLAVPHG